MRLIISTLTCVCACLFATAQYSLPQLADSNKYLHYPSTYKSYPSTYKAFQFTPESSVQKFPGKSFIVPGAMILYGFLAAKTDPTLDINEHIRKELWTASPHKQQHIDNYLVLAPALAVYGLNIAGVKGKNNFLDRSMIYVVSSLISNTAVFALKKVTHEQRPDNSDYYSFPSGHTAQAFVSAEFLCQEYKDVSPWYGVAGYAVAASVGYLRMYNNKHWLNDVVAGAGFGIASTRLAYWLYPKIKNKFSPAKPLYTMVMPSYDNGSYGISLVHFFH